MSALVAIVCDQCRDIGTVAATPQDARAELRGWRRHQGMDLCPLCAFIHDSRIRATAASRPSFDPWAR